MSDFQEGSTGRDADGSLHAPLQVPPRHPRWLRGLSVAMSSVFAWMALLATPAQVLAHPAPLKRPGVRLLPASEMARLIGSQVGIGGGTLSTHEVSVALASGSTFP